MNILETVEKFAREEYKSNDEKHQFSHVEDVMERALLISESDSEVDYELLKLAILFHDIDYTSYETHVDDSVIVAEKFLKKHDYSPERTEKVLEIMLDHSTPHRRERGDAKSFEGKIIYDADKSIFIHDKETADKYFPLLYLPQSKEIVKKQLK
jgi:HD superfamily phosphodiesterase